MDLAVSWLSGRFANKPEILKKKMLSALFFDASGNKNIGAISALVKRFGVFRMRDFFCYTLKRYPHSRGGVSGHCLIEASGMIPPKLGHISGILAFPEFFLATKRDPTPGQITF